MRCVQQPPDKSVRVNSEFGKVPEDPADAVADDINNPVNHITFLLY